MSVYKKDLDHIYKAVILAANSLGCSTVNDEVGITIFKILDEKPDRFDCIIGVGTKTYKVFNNQIISFFIDDFIESDEDLACVLQQLKYNYSKTGSVNDNYPYLSNTYRAIYILVNGIFSPNRIYNIQRGDFELYY